MVNLIWATCGKSWGFRFLLNGGYSDPLLAYERAFADLQSQRAACRRLDEQVALRFPDPLNRRDEAGRVIPHDFVVMGPLADKINSVNDGLREIWPLVAEVYDQVWDAASAPSMAAVSMAVDSD
ncbi:hypothetical protein SDC9_126121 [bioreactor metagenome]|jgi:hypothetical protein|uniref:Uncharacterized protein n=1 Tax=bioreactor metagenome TaxID=1076179 RepID=A0A645CPR7_9ZZZZ